MSDSAEPADVSPVPVEPVTEIHCWRCDLSAPATMAKCPHCGARLATIAPREVAETTGLQALVKALIFSFVFLLVTGIVHGVVVGVMIDDAKVIDDSLRHKLLIELLILEALDSLVIAVVVAKYGASIGSIAPSTGRRVLAWVLSLPLLAGLLAVNTFYHWVLRSYLHVPLLEGELTAKLDALLILTYCVQPAIFEELYFRGFALGTLTKLTNTTAAVLISALMFGMVHLAVPLSIPYLIGFGLVFGFIRLNCGTIWLPILLHFLHNLIVTFLDHA